MPAARPPLGAQPPPRMRLPKHPLRPSPPLWHCLHVRCLPYSRGSKSAVSPFRSESTLGSEEGRRRHAAAHRSGRGGCETDAAWLQGKGGKPRRTAHTEAPGRPIRQCQPDCATGHHASIHLKTNDPTVTNRARLIVCMRSVRLHINQEAVLSSDRSSVVHPFSAL